jgi:hypothetical protein
MAAFTSKATGNWSSGGQTTWNEVGVPASGDTVTIGAHTITVDANTTIGTSPNDATTMVITLSSASSNLVVAAAKTLTVKGNFQMANSSTLTLRAGAALTFDNSGSGGSPVYVITNGGFSNYTFEGTTGAHCTLSAIVGQTFSISGAAWNNVAITFTDFLRCSASTIGSVNGDVSLTDCTFTGCTQLRVTDSSLTHNIILRRCFFTSGTHATDDLNLSMSTAGTVTATREVSGCSLEKIFTNNVRSLSCFNNYFGNGVDTNTNASFLKFQNNFVKHDGDRNGGAGQLMPSSFQRNYFVVDDSGGNSHFVAPQALQSVDTYVDQNIFESNSADITDVGDCALLNSTATSGGFKVIGRNNIVLPSNAASAVTSGCLLTLFSSASGVRTEWFRNTGNVNVSTVVGQERRGMFAVGEGNNGTTGQVTALKSNLAWSAAASGGYFFERVLGNVKDIADPTGIDYNYKFNLSTGDNLLSYEDKVAANTIFTAGTAVAAGVDSHGGTADPDFVDEARDIAKWNLSRGGAGTYAAGIAALKADPTLAANLIAYVFAGFKIQNADLRNAAHDGGPIGAANYHNADRSLTLASAVGDYLETKFGISGSGVDFDFPVGLEGEVSIDRVITGRVTIRG